ncbi:MAG: hypothetical protein ACK41T_02320 [Pseudobdellovibrio sp.]
MKNLMKTPILFITAYMPLLIATYILPYMGSNSYLLSGMARAGEKLAKTNGAVMPETLSASTTLSLLTFVHIGALLGLVAIAFYRGKNINKSWIWCLPLIAGFFDMTPVLNYIPFVPTLFHIMTLFFGVQEQEKQKLVTN